MTRAEVLIALRRLPQPITCGELAREMQAPSYTVSNSLIALYARDLVDRTPIEGARQKFAYRAKAVHA